MKLYTGTSGYAYKEWKGSFYPVRIQPGEMLHFYGEHLKTVEINNTFYQMPKEKILTSWAEQVPDDFVFAIKAPQVITHLKRLRNVDAEIAYLFRTLTVLDEKLGPVLFQFPASFHADRQALQEFLDLLPGDFPCAFDFRSSSWLDDEILRLIRERGCGLCIEDVEEKPATEIVSTSSWGYLRLRRSDYTDSDIKKWLERVVSQKWKRAFVFFKHEGDARGPEMALRFQKLADSAAKKRGIREPRGNVTDQNALHA